MAGSHRRLSEAEVYTANPSRIIVEDFAPEDQIERLRKILDALGSGGSVFRFTRFFDEFWGAEAAADAAMRDSESTDADSLFEAKARGTNDRHVSAVLRLGAVDVPDSRAMEFGFSDGGTCMAVLADAGLGKSELLRWHEWRYSSFYKNALLGRRPMDLPPVALRVPLRDFKSLSLDYVAHNLSQPPEIGRAPLPRISSGAMLRELMVQGRLILFLDGLDEIAANSKTVDEGLSEWRSVVRDGGNFVLTSRTGHEVSRGTIARRFDLDEVAQLRPLDKRSAHELLTKRGADRLQADRVIAALSGPSAGVPLFLLLANHVGLDVKPSQEVAESRTLVLLQLLRHFCERDQDRLGISAADQMDVLTQIAEWSMETGPTNQEQLLRNLGIDEGDALARIVRNPHALLANNSGQIEFKFPEFGALFTARAIAESWQTYGFNSVSDILHTQKLEDLVVEYLARLLHPAVVSGAWISSESEPAFMLRRNLLAVALARVSDLAHGETHNLRATELARALGNMSLVNVSLSGLYVDRFDFAGWQMKGIHGHGGTLNYCVNLWRTDHDDTAETISTDGCNFDRPAENVLDLSVGIERLRRLLRPLRRKNGGLVPIMSRDESGDAGAWGILVRLGLAHFSGKASTARWTLNGDAIRILTSFTTADRNGHDDLVKLIEGDHEIRELVEKMAKP